MRTTSRHRRWSARSTLLERFEIEAERTRSSASVVELRSCGRCGPTRCCRRPKIAVEGFQPVDEEKLQRLARPAVVELHRNGMLMLMNVHLASLVNLRHLVQRKTDRMLAERAQGDSGGA